MYGLYCSVPDALSYGLYLWVVLAHYIKCGKREQGIRNYRYQNDLYLLFLLPVSYIVYTQKRYDRLSFSMVSILLWFLLGIMTTAINNITNCIS